MDITDALDSYLTAKVKLDKWRREFETKFYKPIADVLIDIALREARNNPMYNREEIEKKLSPEALRKFRGE
jgi:hypothetical protein